MHDEETTLQTEKQSESDEYAINDDDLFYDIEPLSEPSTNQSNHYSRVNHSVPANTQDSFDEFEQTAECVVIRRND